MTSLSAVAAAIRAAADTIPITFLGERADTAEAATSLLASATAGTGIPIVTFTEALKEFLATAQRPTCVRWREVR